MSDRPKLRPPLTGREELLERMMSRLALGLEGRGSFLLLSGESGSGKTRLSEEFQRLASSVGCACTSSSCTSGQMPYFAFIKGLAPLSEIDPSLQGLASYRELCQGQDSLSPGIGEERMFFAAEDVIRSFSERTPLVLRVEDLQYADARTIQMLHFLARGITGCRAIVVGTLSDDELFDQKERPHPLIEAVRVMKREGVCEEMALAPLSEGQLAMALGSMLEEDLDQSVIAALYKESRGNPEIAVELALDAVRSGALVLGQEQATLAAGRAFGVPSTLRDWVGRKLEALPEDHLWILQCAALLGDDFDEATLSRALGRQRMETLELLDAAVRKFHLYVEEGEGYAFRWPVVRRVAIERMPNLVREELEPRIEAARSVMGPS